MKPPQRFDLIVFDWDGTLFDSTTLIVYCIQQACKDLGFPVPSREDAAYTIGMGFVEALTHAAPTLPRERYKELAQRYHHHYVERQDDLRLFDGTLAMLNSLKARQHRLAVATGKARRGLNEALTQAQLHGLFDATRTADETASKPDPCMLIELMDELGVAPQRTLMIGDTTHDLLLATNAGTERVAVSFGAHEPEGFAAHGPLYIAPSTADLHDWLLRHA